MILQRYDDFLKTLDYATPVSQELAVHIPQAITPILQQQATCQIELKRNFTTEKTTTDEVHIYISSTFFQLRLPFSK